MLIGKLSFSSLPVEYSVRMESDYGAGIATTCHGLRVARLAMWGREMGRDF